MRPELHRLDLPVPPALARALSGFRVGDQFADSEIAREVEEFLTSGAFDRHTAVGVSITYVWFDRDEDPPTLMGYFSLSAASVRLDEESDRLDLPFPLIPVIRLAEG